MNKKIFCVLKLSVSAIGTLVLTGMLLAGTASANSLPPLSMSFDFYKLTNNNVENIAGQLKGNLYNYAAANAMYSLGLAGDNYVLFTFTNNVGVASSISEVYFDDGTILAQYGIHNSLGGSTDFGGPGANPGNLPGGNTANPPFVATAGFSVDAQGNPSKGVDTNTDILGISFQLQDDQTYSDTVSALLGGEDLRIGMHIRAIGVAGGSDGYISVPYDPICLPGDPDCEAPTPTPEPASMLLFGTGLIGVAGAARRRRKNRV